MEVAMMILMMIGQNSEMVLGTCNPQNQVLTVRIMCLMWWSHSLSIFTDTFGRRMSMKYIRCMKAVSRNWVRGYSSRATGLRWRWLPPMSRMTMCFACFIRKCGSGICMLAYSPHSSSDVILGTIIATFSRSFCMETWICSCQISGCGIWWMNLSTSSSPSASIGQNWSKGQTMSWPCWSRLMRYHLDNLLLTVCIFCTQVI